ncbi:hypothetical protein NKH86_06855 [Mesorhizobium sp. M0913]|uniref:hypothetical protein n=1 Tax=Mesorhizobium sp. M0913 TaxID=2957026 RepID=UPI00333D84EE
MGAPLKGSIDAAASFRRISDLIETGAPLDLSEATRLMLTLAELITPPASDRLILRKAVLRRIRASFYPGLAFTAAARLIATEWRSVAAHDSQIPGSKSDYFARLTRAGVRPIAWRTIAEDLDYELDLN